MANRTTFARFASCAAVCLTILMVATSARASSTPAQPHTPPVSGHLPETFTPLSFADALQRHLERQVLPFWTAPGVTDQLHGGYLSGFDADGNATDADGPKNLITQLRVLYVHALAIPRAASETDRHRIRRQYDQGLDFIQRSFRDPAGGGWCYEVARDGAVTDPARRSSGAIQVIYILSEAYCQVGGLRARRLASQTFDWLDEHAHDDVHGGYLERGDLPAEAPENRTKSTGTNMHAALALARLLQIAPSDRCRERLQELLGLLTRNALVAGSGNAYLALGPDWRPLPPEGDAARQVLYGHNAELMWYVQDVARALGKSPSDLLPWLRRIADGIIRDGLAPDGAVCLYGPLKGRSTDSDEIRWWIQTEVMIALARMHQATGEAKYLRAFERVCRLTFGCLVVDDSGAWLGGVSRKTGERLPRGGWGLKAGFHVARAMEECATALRTDARAGGPPVSAR